MKLSHKIYLAIGAALLVGVLFFAANHLTNRLLSAHAATLTTLGEMEREERAIDEQLLNAVFLLYVNYDPIHQLLAALRTRVERLEKEEYFADEGFRAVRHTLGRYRTLIDRKEELLLRFATLNSMIKNSVTQIPTLSDRYIERFGAADVSYLREIAHVTAVVFLVSNSFDRAQLAELHESERRLAQMQPEGEERSAFHQTFLAHTRVFADNFSAYYQTFEQLQSLPSLTTLDQVREQFLHASGEQAWHISLLTLVLAVLFVACIGLVVYMLIRLDREHKALMVLHERLHESATTDRLTHIKNRFAFERERAHLGEQGALFLVNVDGFGHLNDLYGHAVGDLLLKQVAAELASRFGKLPGMHLYRLGGDEFGLFCEQPGEIDRQALAQAIVATLEEHELMVQGHRIPVSVSLGLSLEQPFLEKADMALKEVKRERIKVLEYSAELGVERRVADNMHTMEKVKRAILEDRVVPYFQPILNLRSDQIDRYECLVRVVEGDDVLLSPHQFLAIAKESRLYGELARIMLRKCFARFADTHLGFHINLSINDINDPEVHETLFGLLEANPGIGSRLTLEILESEQVGNYTALERFLSRVREHGCQVAIDDFGSGYSNLSHLLRLAVDNLKIDGSLIQDLDTDPNAELMVETIIRLVSAVGIRYTTAEFVHSELVLAEVRRLGISFAQGYVIGKPQPYLLEEA